MAPHIGAPGGAGGGARPAAREAAPRAAGDGLAEFLRRQLELFGDGYSFSGFERDLLALNLGGGRFLDVSGITGADSVGDGRAAVYADFDNDGDADIFLRGMHGPAHLLYRNEIGQDSGFVRIALEGTRSGRDAFGAVARMRTAAGTLTRMKDGGSGFVSQSDPRLLFGLGGEARAEGLEVAWPSGLRQRFEGPHAGDSWLIVEGESAPRPVREQRFRLPDPPPPGEGAWPFLRIRRGDPLPDIRVRRTPDNAGAGSGAGSATAAPAPGAAPRADSLPSLVVPGRRTLVNFWATWCVPCAREMPELQKLHAEAGIPVLGISLDAPDARAGIPAFLARMGVTYPIHVADAETLYDLVSGAGIPLPFSLIVDERGRVVEALTGWSPEMRKRLEEATAVSAGP